MDSSLLSRRAFAERLALAAAAPYLLLDVGTPAPARGTSEPVQAPAPEPSPLARALAEGVRLRYPDRFTPDELKTITQTIEVRLRNAERLYQIALTNGDEPDCVFAVYRAPA